MIEGKGLGNKKINRVNLSLTNLELVKLKQLATACNMSPTTMAAHIVAMALDSSSIVHNLQEKYCINDAYRVVLMSIQGRTRYKVGK